MNMLQRKFNILVTLVQINQKLQRKIVNIFLSISVNICFGFFWAPTAYVLVEKYENYFLIVHPYLEAYS